MDFHGSANFNSPSFRSEKIYGRAQQSDISRSLHELASVGLTNQLRTYQPARRRDPTERPRLPENPPPPIEDYDDRPVLRRKRFTRRQRKSLSIEPETGLILATAPLSSSDDETQAAPPPAPPLKQQSRGLSASTFELGLDTKEERKRIPRGPAARRAGRRHSRLQYPCAASTNNLDRIEESQRGLRSEKRSLSVRDLNGEHCDFRNKESVTKWTSQILAELDSLPSSCVDLSKQEKGDEERKWSTLLSPSLAPPVPSHRISLDPRMSQSTYFPSTARQPSSHVESTAWQPQQLSMTSSLHSNWMTPLDNRVDSSQHYRSNLSIGSGNREREDSLVASTLVGSSTDSDAGTPVAMSPVDQIPMLTSGNTITPDTPPYEPPSPALHPASRSVGVQGPETPLFSCRKGSWESENDCKSSLRIVMSEDAQSVRVQSVPIPAKRTILSKNKINGDNSPKVGNAVKMRDSALVSPSDESLLKSIARLSKNIQNDCKEQYEKNERMSQVSIPSIRKEEEGSWGEDTLRRWKEKRAECQSRVEVPAEVGKSVDRVLASMIKSIEKSRLEAPDRPSSLAIPVIPTDVSTQTSPFSISRSSSFDWMDEANERALRDLNTPVATPRSVALPSLPPVPLPVDSSSETDEADREVAEMTRSVRDQRDREDQSKSVEIARKSDRLYQEMEESIAMLLQYGQQHTNRTQPMATKKMTNPDSPSTRENRAPVAFPTMGMTSSIYDNVQIDKRKRSKVLEAAPVISRESRSGSSDLPPTPGQSIKSIQSIFQQKHNENLLKTKTCLDIPLGQRAGSCEALNTSEPKSPSLVTKENMRKAEEEALEACQWLRKAGFPQYAKQYQEGSFPLELGSVRADHSFLDSDSLRALFRRLDTLNRCTIMRIDNVVLRRRNDNYPYDMYGVDDEDNVALSRNWQYQRHSHTWSRVGNEPMYGAAGRVVSTNQNYANYRDPYAVKDTRDSPYDEGCDRRLLRADITPDGSTSGKLQRSQSERIKDTAKALMKKMNPRSGSRRRRESRPRDPSQLQIGDPVLVSYDSASPESMRMMERAQRQPYITQERGRTMGDRSQQGQRSKSSRRQGIVILSPSSPSSPPNDFSSFPLRSRERSMPPPSSRRGFGTHLDSSIDTTSSPSPYAEYQRFRRERPPLDEYLYSSTTHHPSLGRSKPRLPSRTYYDNMKYYGNSGNSSPAYSSPYSNHSSLATPSMTSSLATPPVRSRQLNIHADGYYLHGSFDAPLDTSSSSSLGRPRPFTSSPSTSTAIPQLRVDTLRNKSQSSLDNTDEEPCGSGTPSQNRRDSGVGSSLSRSPSGPSTQRIRQSILPFSQSTVALSASLSSNASSSNGSWHERSGGKRRMNNADRLMNASLGSCSSSDDAFFTDEQLLRCMDSLNVLELTRVRKLAYLRVTATLERYMGAGLALKIDNMTSSSANKRTPDWTQKLINKIKHLDNRTGKETDSDSVFGQSLETIYKRCGHCLPRPILEILRYLRQMAPDTVGIFRKNGVKSRIGELRLVCDRDAECDIFVETARLDPGQVHDVADLLKQYLRELPDPLMTTRLSEVFASIFIHVPENERNTVLQYTLLLLPDENREALQTLLFFLNDVAKYSQVNNMPAQNLSVCFTPSLFHLSASRLDKVSANRRHRTIGASGMPTEHEMRETRAAQQCLTHLIQHCRILFVSPEMNSNTRCGDCEDDAPLLKNLGEHGPRAYLMERISDLVKENADRWKGWIVDGCVEGVEISSRKPSDGHPLRPLRVWVDVAAPPKEVLHRIMKERAVWDVSSVNWRCIDLVHAPDTDLHQYVLNDTLGHPTRDCYVVRHHRVDMSELRGACAVASRSVRCGETQLLAGVAAAVLDERFLIEPKSGYSRVTRLVRIDLKGRSSQWYGKVYGNVLARQMLRLRDSFKKTEEFGPETKV